MEYRGSSYVMHSGCCAVGNHDIVVLAAHYVFWEAQEVAQSELGRFL
jgi:hypothetical protein